MNKENINKLEKITIEIEQEILKFPLHSNDNDSLKIRIKINALLTDLKTTLNSLKNEDKENVSPYKHQKQYLTGMGPYYIDEKNNFTGTKLASFEFLGQRYEVPKQSWKEFYKKICELFYEAKNREFVRIVLDSQFDTFTKNPSFSKDESSVLKPHKIGNLYMGTNYSADDISKIVRGFMKSLHYKTGDLRIFLADRSDD